MNNKGKKDEWPMETASHAQFLYKISSNNIKPCRLIPNRISESEDTSIGDDKKVQIQIVSWNDQLEVLDCIDPDDVIGAELQIDFPQEKDFVEAFESKFHVSCGTTKSVNDLELPTTATMNTTFVPPTCTNWVYKEEDMEGYRNESASMNIMEIDNDNDKVFSNNGLFCGNASNNADFEASPQRSSNKKLFQNATAYLNIYSYPRSLQKQRRGRKPSDIKKDKKSDYGYRKARHLKLEVTACEDFANARACVRGIRMLAQLGQFQSTHLSTLAQPKRYLVVVNPQSGTGKGKSVYQSKVAPMLEQAGVDHDVCITAYTGHADKRMQKQNDLKILISSNENNRDGIPRQMVKEHDVSLYDAIIAVGGDGILWEILQGIWKRPDRDEILKKIQFGIVGCGTCNGLAQSVLHASQEKYNVLESIFLICKGRTSPMDLSMYYTRNNTYTGFLAFAYGFIADVDLESEKIRLLGTLRTDIWAVWRILNLKSYPSRFSYLPPSKNQTQTSVLPPPLDQPIPSSSSSGWINIEDSFILFWAAQVSHASWDVYNSPKSTLHDGLFRILVIRKSCSRRKLIKLFLKTQSGEHIHEDVCEFYDCVAYRLKPLSNGSYNDLDGEEIEAGPVQACVMPSAIQFFTGSSSNE